MIPTCQVIRFFGDDRSLAKGPNGTCGEPAAFVFSYDYLWDQFGRFGRHTGQTYQCAECHKGFPEVPGPGNVHPEPWRKL